MSQRENALKINNSVGELNANLIEILCEVASKIDLYKKHNNINNIKNYNRNPPWFDSECRTLKKEVNHKLSTCKKK